MKVMTIDGPLERDDLVITDVVTWTDNTREIATEWRCAGKLVRRDVAVSFLMPQDLNPRQGGL